MANDQSIETLKGIGEKTAKLFEKVGIRTIDDFKRLLRAGADKISVNSAAIDRPQLITEAAEKFGSQCVVVAIDARRRDDGGWNIYKHGGRLDTRCLVGKKGGSAWRRRDTFNQHGL